MGARFLKTHSLTTLFQNIQEHITEYRSGDFERVSLDSQDNSFEISSVDVDLSILESLILPDKDHFYEVENSEKVFLSFIGLNRYQATDSRFWSYYCHSSTVLAYTRNRYFKKFNSDDETLIEAVQSHIFGPIAHPRMLFRNNSLGRLWWNYRVALDVDPQNPKDILEVFLFHTDFRANIIERPGLFSTNAGKACLLFAKEKFLEDKNHSFFKCPRGKELYATHFHYREMAIRLNRLGSLRNLAYLKPEKIVDLIKDAEDKFNRENS